MISLAIAIAIALASRRKLTPQEVIRSPKPGVALSTFAVLLKTRTSFRKRSIVLNACFPSLDIPLSGF